MIEPPYRLADLLLAPCLVPLFLLLRALFLLSPTGVAFAPDATPSLGSRSSMVRVAPSGCLRGLCVGLEPWIEMNSGISGFGLKRNITSSAICLLGRPIEHDLHP